MMITTKFKISHESAVQGVPGRCSSCAIALELEKLNPCMEPSVYLQYDYIYGVTDRIVSKALAFLNSESYISPVETVLACVTDFDRIVFASAEEAPQEKHKFYERWKDQEFELVHQLTDEEDDH